MDNLDSWVQTMSDDNEQQKEHIISKYDIKDYIQPPIHLPDIKDKKGIVLIVGSSGSGKSTILNECITKKHLVVNHNIPIIDNFSSPQRAEELLLAVGLRSIPAWFRTIDQVSNGEKHRAEAALSIDQGINYIDEFTSVVDRDTAKSLSVALHKYFKKSGETIFVATPHFDIEEWLIPDVIYDTDKKQFKPKEFLRRPDIRLTIESTTREDWVYFEKHHYLDSKLSKSSHCYVAKIGNKKVGFLAIMHGTGGSIPTYWRESRLVVLPEFQGLGIGKTLSDTIAQEYFNRGLRYFSKTAHSALGEYRESSTLWKPTSKNKKKRLDYLAKMSDTSSDYIGKFKKETLLRDSTRLAYSHEFIGKH